MSEPINPIPPRPPSRWRSRIPVITFILGLLLVVALLLPATRSGGGVGRRLQCSNILRTVALALAGYESTYHALPPSCTLDHDGRPLHSWRTLILPYLDESDLYRSIDLSRPWDHPANSTARGTALSLYLCPASSAPRNTTTYLANTDPSGLLRPGLPRLLSDVTDSRQETLTVIEADDAHAIPWMAPTDADASLILALAHTEPLHHPGGVNAAFLIGSIRFLKSTVPAATRRALISIAGHETVTGQEPITDDEF